MDIIPDQLLKYTVTPYTNQTYSLTVFSTTQPDLEFTAHGSVSSGGSSAYIKVTSLNPNLYISFGRWDSVYVPGGPSWNITKVARPLTLGEQINAAGSIWENTTLFLTDHSGSGGGNKNVNDWIGGDKFLGLKYVNGANTTYGWIRVQCTDEDSCYVKEYSYAPITTAIKEQVKDDITVYPNPASSAIYVVLGKNEHDLRSLKLSDALGREVKANYEVKDGKIKIELDKNIPEGCYFLQYKLGEASFIRKVIRDNR
jgi:hypothetical protein